MKVKKKKILYIVLALAVIIIIGVLAFVAKWLMDNHNTKKQIDSLYDEFIDEEALAIENPDTEEANKDPDYVEYTKMLVANVDFNSLLKKNEDTVAWLYVPGTNINYPIVQSNDNDYYLIRSFSKKSNSAGWAFLDYRNNANELNKNSIIYAHARLDKSMFGTLHYLRGENWFSSKEHNYVTLLTQSTAMTWQIYSVYNADPYDNYTAISFYADSTYSEFLNETVDRSIHSLGVEVNANDKILTLSTCANNDKRLVVHAKLIETTNR